MKELILPASLEGFRDQMIATRRPFIRIKAGAAAPQTALIASKVGGTPYLPKGTEWPNGPDGTPLNFLVQINFEEAKAAAPFPSKGILQFYIADDDLYGMDFDDGAVQDTFRVLYFPDVTSDQSQLQTNLPMQTDYECLPHHPEECYPLSFLEEEEYVPCTDGHFWEVFGGDFFQKFGEQEWAIQEDFGKKVRADGHKIGGYAYFTQDDPRRKEDPMLLLLQLDSDEGMDLMWGDMGVGHFFIREADLLALDFSRVLYDWDCL